MISLLQEAQKISEVLKEKENEVQSRARTSDPLAEKLTSIESQLFKLEKNKDHYLAKMKEYGKSLEEMKTVLAKKKALLDQQTAKAAKWSETEVEANRKPEAIHRDSESYSANQHCSFICSEEFIIYNVCLQETFKKRDCVFNFSYETNKIII